MFLVSMSKTLSSDFYFIFSQISFHIHLGNDFGGITIRSKDVIERAKAKNYPITADNVLLSPDGYRFFIIPEDQPASDPVVGVAINSTDLEKSVDFWSNVLNMNVISKSDSSAVLSYKENTVQLELKKIGNLCDDNYPMFSVL